MLLMHAIMGLRWGAPPLLFIGMALKVTNLYAAILNAVNTILDSAGISGRHDERGKG